MDAYGDEEWKDSESEDEQGVESPFQIQKSYVLIAIDVHDSMFTTNGSERSAFLNCLEACCTLYNSLILADRGSVRGPIAIVLANNEAGKATFIEFEQPIPESVKLLKDLGQLTNDELKDKYLRKEMFDLGDFFLFCKNKLATITSGDNSRKNVYYITNNDNPTLNDATKRFKIINESQKFAALEINLFVVTFKVDFDHETLYSEVLTASNSPPIEVIKDTEGLTSKISDLVKRRFTKYRIKFYPFVGDTESSLELVINKFVKSTNTSKNMYVTRDTQKEVKKLTKSQRYTTKYACTFSRKLPPIIINDLEKASLMETNIPIGLTLLHVSNANLKKGWIIEPPSLIEKHYNETGVIFDAFWQFCVDKSKCLVCLRKYKKGGEIRLMELVPRLVNSRRMFVAFAYPFGTDIHYTPKTVSQVQFPQKQQDVMTSLVNKLTFDFDPLCFSDPIESKRRAYIKSQLLEEALEEESDGIPNDMKIDKQINSFVEEFNRLGLVQSVEASAPKRSAASNGRTSKRAKK